MASLADLQDVEFNDFSTWPQWLRVVGVALIVVAIVVAGYWFFIKGQLETLEIAEKKEQELRKTFLARKALAVNLPAYRAQMKEIQERFAITLKQLPQQTEIPALLVDITQAGLARGLEFELFKPKPKEEGDFYATQPIDVKVMGQYHMLADFVSDLAALPRIVSLGDIEILPIKDTPDQLTMKAVTKTYHYLDEEEIAAKQDRSGEKVRTTRQ